MLFTISARALDESTRILSHVAPKTKGKETISSEDTLATTYETYANLITSIVQKSERKSFVHSSVIETVHHKETSHDEVQRPEHTP